VPPLADDLVELGASFARALRAEGRATRTVTLYLVAVRFFGLWLTERGHPSTLEELTRNNIREWLADLTDRGQAAGTSRWGRQGAAPRPVPVLRLARRRGRAER
jgi:site-specific recombinase XerD